METSKNHILASMSVCCKCHSCAVSHELSNSTSQTCPVIFIRLLSALLFLDWATLVFVTILEEFQFLVVQFKPTPLLKDALSLFEWCIVQFVSHLFCCSLEVFHRSKQTVLWSCSIIAIISATNAQSAISMI